MVHDEQYGEQPSEEKTPEEDMPEEKPRARFEPLSEEIGEKLGELLPVIKAALGEVLPALLADLKPDISKASQAFLDGLVEAGEELEPQLHQMREQRARRLRDSYTTLTNAGFSKDEAFSIVLAGISGQTQRLNQINEVIRRTADTIHETTHRD